MNIIIPFEIPSLLLAVASKGRALHCLSFIVFIHCSFIVFHAIVEMLVIVHVMALKWADALLGVNFDAYMHGASAISTSTVSISSLWVRC